MKTVGDKLENFVVTGVKPGALTPDGAFEDITDLSFEGKWKVIVFYPNLNLLQVQKPGPL